MKREDLEQLLKLLTAFRDDAVDREEWEEREKVRFYVKFELDNLADHK